MKGSIDKEFVDTYNARYHSGDSDRFTHNENAKMGILSQNMIVQKAVSRPDDREDVDFLEINFPVCKNIFGCEYDKKDGSKIRPDYIFGRVAVGYDGVAMYAPYGLDRGALVEFASDMVDKNIRVNVSISEQYKDQFCDVLNIDREQIVDFSGNHICFNVPYFQVCEWKKNLDAQIMDQIIASREASAADDVQKDNVKMKEAVSVDAGLRQDVIDKSSLEPDAPVVEEQDVEADAEAGDDFA